MILLKMGDVYNYIEHNSDYHILYRVMPYYKEDDDLLPYGVQMEILDIDDEEKLSYNVQWRLSILYYSVWTSERKATKRQYELNSVKEKKWRDEYGYGCFTVEQQCLSK